MLNNGAKWQGDENLPRGMADIRDAVQAQAGALHSGTIDAPGRKALAGEIMQQVDFIVANCKLSPEADEHIHIILGQVIDGAAALEGEGPTDVAAATIVTALDAYGVRSSIRAGPASTDASEGRSRQRGRPHLIASTAMPAQMPVRRIIAPRVRVSYAPPRAMCQSKAANTAAVARAMPADRAGAQAAPRHRPSPAAT